MSVAARTLIVGGTVAIAVVARAAFPLGGLTPVARREIPPAMVEVYQSAARRCVGLPWQVLAAIGWIESRHAGGAADPSTGDLAVPVLGPAPDGGNGAFASPDATQSAGSSPSLGPMGLSPSAWEEYGRLAPGRPAGATPSVHNAWDAIYATAGELCDGVPLIGDLNRAIRGHNTRASYVVQVMIKAAEYRTEGVDLDVTALMKDSYGERDEPAAKAVVAAALQVLGTPYVWGAESPSSGFDCSGLVWWAYQQAGVTVTRTTQEQIHAGAAVTGEELRPGDLLFTRGGRPAHDLGHVAIYAGDGMEVVAPSSGKSVTLQRVDPDRVQAVRRFLTPG